VEIEINILMLSVLWFVGNDDQKIGNSSNLINKLNLIRKLNFKFIDKIRIC